MEFLNSLQQKLSHLSTKEFYRYAGIYIGCVVALTGGVVYFHFSTVNSLNKKVKAMRSKRNEIKRLLQKHALVQKQSKEINNLLEEEKNFKIKSFFDNLVTLQSLQSKQKKEAEVTEEILYKKYTEIKLKAQFRQMNTMLLAQLLDAIEAKKRVYVKELTITKTRGASIDISLVIATLKPQSSTKS